MVANMTTKGLAVLAREAVAGPRMLTTIERAAIRELAQRTIDYLDVVAAE